MAAWAGCGDVAQASGQVGVAQVHEPAECRAHRAEVSQTFLGVATVQLEMLPDQAREQGMAVDVEIALVEQDLIEGLGLVGDPSAEGGDQGVATDEVVLKRQQAEKQVSGGVMER
jgi:hypothetical protein